MDSLRKKPIQSYHSKPPQKTRVTYDTYQTPRYSPPPYQETLTSKITKKQPARRIARFPWKIAFFILFCVAASWVGYFSWKIYTTTQAIQIQSESSATQAKSTFSTIHSIASSLLTKEHTPLKGEVDGRINILLLGKAGEENAGHDLTDTIMVMSIDLQTKKIALLSLPRDLYVRIPETSFFTKINALYRHGLSQGNSIDSIQKSVEAITGLPIHYFFVIDFDGFEKVIDTIGGVNVEVMRDIHDDRYPGPNYSYETFDLKKGWQVLDGATTLKYVRERHDDPEGDFGRAKRQQQVIQAVKNKAFSLQTFLDVFTLNNLLNVLSANIKTNIKPEEIENFIALSKQVDTQNITNVVIDAWKPDSLLRVSHVFVGPTRMFILIPRVGNYSEIQDVATHIFDLNTIKRRKEAIQNEQTTITIVNQSGNSSFAYKIQKILEQDLGFEKVIINRSSSTNTIQSDSFIVDRTNQQKPFSLDEILKKFHVTLSTDSFDTMNQEENTNSDFIFILGHNLNQTLDFEEDSIEDFKQSENDNDIVYPEDIVP